MTMGEIVLASSFLYGYNNIQFRTEGGSRHDQRRRPSKTNHRPKLSKHPNGVCGHNRPPVFALLFTGGEPLVTAVMGNVFRVGLNRDAFTSAVAVAHGTAPVNFVNRAAPAARRKIVSGGQS
jgi:hypothetical protein